MKRGSMLYKWFLAEFKDDHFKIRAIEQLLDNGHTGFAETAVVRSLKAKMNGYINEYTTDKNKEIKAKPGIKVQMGERVYYI